MNINKKILEEYKHIITMDIICRSHANLFEHRSTLSEASNVIRDKFVKFVETNYDFYKNIVNFNQHFLCSIKTNCDPDSISDEQRDGYINFFIKELDDEQFDVQGYGLCLRKEKKIFINLSNKIKNIFTFSQRSDKFPQDIEHAKTYRESVRGTIRHELEHCLDFTENGLMAQLIEKFPYIKDNGLKDVYLKKVECDTTMIYDVMINETNYNTWKNLVNEHLRLLETTELSAYITGMKSELASSNKKIGYFHFLLMYTSRMGRLNFNFSNVSYERTEYFKDYITSLILFVIKQYIPLSLYKYPNLKKFLIDYKFKIFDKEYMFNLDQNKFYQV